MKHTLDCGCEQCDAAFRIKMGVVSPPEEDDHEPNLKKHATTSVLICEKIEREGLPDLSFIEPTFANREMLVSDEQKRKMEEASTFYFAKFLESLGVDWKNDPNSDNTPYRVAKSYTRELWAGRFDNLHLDSLTSFPNQNDYDQMLVVGPISVKSMCSHHHREIEGCAIVGALYGSNSTLIGLSKFSRIVNHFSRRGQIQEELTKQLEEVFSKVLKPEGLGIVITCKHHCMSHRGVNEPNTLTSTSALTGIFRDDSSVRAEFLNRVAILEQQHFHK